MALIDQHVAPVFDSIGVGCSGATTHENHTNRPTKTKIHSSLEAHPFLPAHFHIGNDVAGLDHLDVKGTHDVRRAKKYKAAPDFGTRKEVAVI